MVWGFCINNLAHTFAPPHPSFCQKRLLIDKKLWNNEGKTETADVSRTGYDFSLVKVCIKKGITDINDLVAILTLRPRGAFQGSGKDEQYIMRTIGNALYK